MTTTAEAGSNPQVEAYRAWCATFKKGGIYEDHDELDKYNHFAAGYSLQATRIAKLEKVLREARKCGKLKCKFCKKKFDTLLHTD